MIRLKIENFKCFRSIEVDCKPLTVLSGVNGMGKSTFMQALLLLRQSALGRGDNLQARLNGELVKLGYADDVLYENAEDQAPIAFTLQPRGCDAVLFEFEFEKGRQALNAAKAPSASTYSDLPLFGEDVYYLKAERIGPRTSFDTQDEHSGRYNRIGNAGEYCAWLLAENERAPIGVASLCHPAQPLNELRLQVEAWLSEIGQTPRIHLDQHASMDKVSLQFSFLRDGIPSSNYRPTNVGFGLTYALPIFVCGLLAKPGGVLLIENPEAHLHPKGQLAMGKFLAKVADGGVNVFVETHSDHLLNGIRIAAKNKTIKPDDTALLFFERKSGAQATSVTIPKMDENGRLDHWPEGFFDEWENGLMQLL